MVDQDPISVPGPEIKGNMNHCPRLSADQKVRLLGREGHRNLSIHLKDDDDYEMKKMLILII